MGSPPRQERPVLASAHTILEQLRGLGVERILLGYSGGKDSSICFDLLARGGFDVQPFFMRCLGIELRCEEAPLRAFEEQHGVTVLRLPHWEMANILKYAKYRPHLPARHTPRRRLELVDIEALARQKTGWGDAWCVYGYKSTDSLHRRAMIHRWGAVDQVRRRAYPIADWADRHVLAYICAHNLPLHPLSRGGRMGGVALRPETLARLRDDFPDDYAKIIRAFPFAIAAVAKYDALVGERESS